MSKNRKNNKKPNKKSPKPFRFHALDWLCILFGVLVSIITPFIDHNHSPIYSIVSIAMLICGIFEMILGIKGRRSNYIFAIINTFTSIYIAWSDQFYGNMAINIYYIPICIFGFYSWGKHRNKKKDVIARKLSIKQIILATTIFIATSIILNILLQYFGGHATLLDSASTILIIFASILGVLRYREQWILWIVVDALTLIMWLNTGSPAAIAMRTFYVFGSIYGYFNWRKFINHA